MICWVIHGRPICPLNVNNIFIYFLSIFFSSKVAKILKFSILKMPYKVQNIFKYDILKLYVLNFMFQSYKKHKIGSKDKFKVIKKHTR